MSEESGESPNVGNTPIKKIIQPKSVQFPVAKLLKRLKKGRYAKYIRREAAVYMGSVLQYLASEVNELSGEICKLQKKRRVMPRHIQLAIQKDLELKELCKTVIIRDGGVLPKIESSLLVKKTRAQKARK